MKILFIDSTHPYLYEELTKLGHSCDLGFDWNKEKILQNIALYDGIVIRSKIKIDQSFINAATNLKFIARVGAGMENIDVTYAESKNIKCLHAPEGNRDAVAEHAIAMLLSLFNNLNKADKEVRNGKWKREENRGIELGGKTIGIIGIGNTGSSFGHKTVGFGVKSLGYDKYFQFNSRSIISSSLEQIFEEADVISLHVPLTEETTYLVNDSFINNFKKNIYLINTSRGKVVNTDDLVKNIKSGKILGACLDVIEYEASSFENIDTEDLPEAFQYLIKSDKVILSPHIAGWTHESNLKMAKVLADKITLFSKSL